MKKINGVQYSDSPWINAMMIADRERAEARRARRTIIVELGVWIAGMLLCVSLIAHFLTHPLFSAGSEEGKQETRMEDGNMK